MKGSRREVKRVTPWLSIRSPGDPELYHENYSNRTLRMRL